MGKIFLKVVLSTVICSFNFVFGGDIPANTLKIPSSAKIQSISISGEIISHTAPMNLPDQELRKRADKTKENYLAANKNFSGDPFLLQENALAIWNSEYNYIKNGSEKKYEFTYFRSGDSLFLSYFPIADKSNEIIEVYKGGVFYSFNKKSNIISVDKITNLTGEFLGQISRLIASPGRPNPDWLLKPELIKKNLVADGLEINYNGPDEGETITLASNFGGIVKEDKITQKKFNYVERLSFGKYKDTAGIPIPHEIRYTLDGWRQGFERTVQISSISLNKDVPKIEFIPDNFGPCQINDGRFVPRLSYYSNGHLASDQDLVKWANSPGLLREHNLQVLTGR